MDPPLNVDFWTTFYRADEDPDSTYESVLATHTSPVARAAALWNWKDLGRGVPFEAVREALERFDFETYCSEDPATAVSSLGDHLVEHGALANTTVVTPAFVLHLAASDPNEYAVKFPIFDVRVWTAYVYLSGRRTGDSRLPAGATNSPRKYGEFVDFFAETIPSDTGGRVYERALFRFGAYISRVPATTVAEIDTHLAMLGSALSSYQPESQQPLYSPTYRE